MKHCELMASCSVFTTNFSDITKEVYRSTYCSNKNGYSCARRKLFKQGNNVPDDLLPSGKSILY